MKVYVRKGDIVITVSGKDKGKIGEILKVNPEASKVIVQGVNVVKKRRKSTRANTQGGMIEEEGAICSSKAMSYYTRYKNTTGISNRILEDGIKARVCKKCGEAF